MMRPIFILLAQVVMFICLLFQAKINTDLRNEISEIWEMLAGISNIAHDNEEAIRAVKSRLDVHRISEGDDKWG